MALAIVCLGVVGCSESEKRAFMSARVTSCIPASDGTIKRIDLAIAGEIKSFAIVNNSPSCGTFSKGRWDILLSTSSDGDAAEFISAKESRP